MIVTELPLEVLHVIVAGQSRKKLKVLRQVCRIFNQLAEPCLFSAINLTVLTCRNGALDPFYNLLASLADGTTNVGSHVRSLTVARLTPSPHGTVTQKTLAEMKADGKHFKKHHDEKMKMWFSRAIGSLTGLRRVSWSLNDSDPQWIRQCIVQCLSDLPMLEELNVEWNSEIYGDLCLNGITNLKKLRIEGTPPTMFDGLLDQAVSIISSSPNLTGLSIAINDYDNEGQELFFNTLFSMLPPSLPPLKLVEVTSICCPLRLDAISLPHLKELKSLKMEGRPDEEPDDLVGNEQEDWELVMDGDFSDEEEEEDTEEGAEEQKEEGSPRQRLQPKPVLVDLIQARRPLATQFWNTLLLSDVQLERLDLEDLDHAALAYLASYNGLRALHLPDIDASRSALIEHLATTFYADVLPKHIATLEELTIASSYMSAWSVGAHNFKLFAQCGNLKTIHVSWEPDAAGSIGTLYSILDMSKTFPRLRSLSISFAFPRSIRGARCGNPWYKCRMRYHAKVKDLLPKYEGVEMTKSLYMVQLGDLRFKLRRGEESESKGYRYQFAPSKTRRKGFLGD